MSNPNEQDILDDVLDTFVASGTALDSATLAEWIRRFPQYEQELTHCAASWSLMQSMPDGPGTEAVTEDVLISRGLKIIGNLLAASRLVPGTGATPVVQSLLAEGRARGLGPRQLARAVSLGDSVLRKLDRRLIRFTTIPHEAIERLAVAIQRDATSVIQYLQQGPTVATAATYRSEQAPQLGEPEDFAAAVRSDTSMSEQDRAMWLELASRTQP